MSDPRKRYASAADLAEDLTRFLEQKPIEARPPGKIEQGKQWCRRNPSRAALLGVCFAAMLFSVFAGAWVNRRLKTDLARMEIARDEARENAKATQRALVNQAAVRIDGEMSELAVIPAAVAAVAEVKPIEDGQHIREWMAKLVNCDPRIQGLRVAFEPDGGTGFALLVQRGPNGIIYRRMDREGLTPPYWERSWFTLRNVWTEPYFGTDAARTPLVSFGVPIHRGGKTIGVVVLDVAVHRLQSLRDEIQNLFPDIEDRSELMTARGAILLHPEDGSTFPDAGAPGKTILESTLPTTKWKLLVAFPADGR